MQIELVLMIKMLEKNVFATFGAGCFWGVEAEFMNIKGVVSTKVGFMGGSLKNPSYNEVCSNKTGHAEVVQIIFNPQEISYNDLLKIFWDIHNPTLLNRQGPDVGSQYRSVIFYHNDEQRKIAELSKDKIQRSGKYKKDIVTLILKAEEFYPAEEYHQHYFKKQGINKCPI